MSRQPLATFAIGVLAGAAAMAVLQGRELDRLNLLSSNLRLQYDEVSHENAQLSAQLHLPSPEPLLQAIHVVAKAPDGLTQLQVIQFVKTKVDFFVGRRLQVLIDEPELPAQLLEGQVMTVDGESYVLHVTTILLIGETLYLHVTAAAKIA